MRIFCTYHNLPRSFQLIYTLQQRQTILMGMFIGQHEDTIVRTLLKCMCQTFRQALTKDYFLFIHIHVLYSVMPQR